MYHTLLVSRRQCRRHLRRDLHDGLGPQLASQTLGLDAAIVEGVAEGLQPERLEDLGHAVLVRQAKEFALDIHPLMRAAYYSVDELIGIDALDDIAPQHRAAIAPPLVERLRAALGSVDLQCDTAYVVVASPDVVSMEFDELVRRTFAAVDDLDSGTLLGF